MCFVVMILIIPEGLRAPCLVINLPANRADNYSTMKKEIQVDIIERTPNGLIDTALSSTVVNIV